jgi:hypothetical protein
LIQSRAIKHFHHLFQKYNKINSLKRNAKETFEKNLDTIILENASNSKEYWKLMKMLIKSNKSSYNFPPLKNIVDDIEANIVYDDNEKYVHFSRDVLKIIRNGTAMFAGDTCNILWLIISGPDALFTAKFVITSTISSSVQRMSLIEL